LLHHACSYCSIEVVGAPTDIIAILIDAGANAMAKNSSKRTPAEIAISLGHPSTAAFIEQYGNAPIKSANFIV
jgi:ankyrin repeat protein